jgi:diguanylate cyclase (GGDEF)-like protein
MISARLRSTASLVVVLALVAGGGVLGVLTARAATARALEVHRADRDAFRSVVAKLMYGYFGTGLATLAERAGTGGFTLREGDPGDRAKLRQTVDGSLFFGAGAVLTDLTGGVRTAYLPHGAVPPVSDPGYQPMVRSLMEGKPGMSSVLPMADGRKLLALAVPVRRAGAPVGLLVGYVRLDLTGPSKQFLAGLPLGGGVHLYAVDSRGTIGASTRDADIGGRAPTVKGLQLAAQGGAGLASEERGGVPYVTAYSQIGFGDWAVVIDEPTSAFLGPIESGGTQVQIMLVVALLIAAALVAVLHHRRQLAVQALADQALRDPLTSLPNRILFQTRLDASLTPGSMPPGGIALLFCDLDGFKQVNDGYGHAAGDELLIAVGERLRSCVRETDLVARMGGDEFTVLLDGGADTPGQTLHRAQEVARRVTERLAEPVDVGLGRPPVRVGVSIGVCVLDPAQLRAAGADEAPDILRLADDAMYRAKASKSGPQLATIT